jgi:hypothetical protein
MYLDWGLHTEGVDLRKSTQVLDGRPQVSGVMSLASCRVYLLESCSEFLQPCRLHV